MLAALAIAGCGGESRQAALQALPPATRQVGLSERISERVSAALYAYLPCVTAATKEAADRRAAHPPPAVSAEPLEPPAVSSAQMALQHADDLVKALGKCIQEEAAQRVVDALEEKIKTRVASLVHRLDDYFAASSSPIAKDVRPYVDDEGASIEKAVP
jgi:hypothetical protein